jgi:hypothetical protein
MSRGRGHLIGNALDHSVAPDWRNHPLALTSTIRPAATPKVIAKPPAYFNGLGSKMTRSLLARTLPIEQIVSPGDSGGGGENTSLYGGKGRCCRDD